MHIKEMGGNTAIQNICDAVAKGRKIEQNGIEESFHKSLEKNMHLKGNDLEHILKTEEQMQSNVGISSQRKQQVRKSAAETISIRMNRSQDASVAQEVPVRGISYEDCDRVEIRVLDGYTLKAKRERSETSESDAGNIYVEMKTDDGEIKAMLFSRVGLKDDSTDIMERFAYSVAKMEQV